MTQQALVRWLLCPFGAGDVNPPLTLKMRHWAMWIIQLSGSGGKEGDKHSCIFGQVTLALSKCDLICRCCFTPVASFHYFLPFDIDIMFLCWVLWEKQQMWVGSKFTHGKFCWLDYFYGHFHRFKQTKKKSFFYVFKGVAGGCMCWRAFYHHYTWCV